jgi:hypothetical protein
MGHGYKGDTGHHHSLMENIGRLKSDYTLRNGYFGEKGQGRDFVRNITSDEPLHTAKDFYDKAAYGGIERKMNNGKGLYAKMSDGTILSYREISTSDGTPAVEINIRGSSAHGEIKYQKIHFIERT